MNKYDVIVIGGGHAGVEAACASARIGAKTLLLTLKPENLGEMSCNPAIGGIAKGTIVKEIDALDGIMARAIDMAGIHYKILNKRKGPAVWGPRAQADRDLYKIAVSDILSKQKNLEIMYDSAEAFEVLNNKISSITTKNHGKVLCSALVVTTGTFLNGLIHIGDERIKAGRIGEDPSVSLAGSLYSQKFKMGRLKTGTPPRILRDSINYGVVEVQPGDVIPEPFSYLNDKITVPQINCYVTRTTAKTHQIIRDNISKSPMYSGVIGSKGPRYCPSIEDKIMRFAEKESHQVFIEPEGLNSDLIYPNGISTALPRDVQENYIHSITGFENCKIVRHGYAIEYDYVEPTELKSSLETKKIEGLFLAGQINGTTGYEEAAGQGLVAGANAALKLDNKNFILDRASSYIGVMIDDLIIHGTREPYRMFTSRSEYRLNLRSDNADQRLTEKGFEVGLVEESRYKTFKEKEQEIAKLSNLLKSEKYTPATYISKGHKMSQDGIRRSLFEFLSYPSIETDVIKRDFLSDIEQTFSDEAWLQVSISAKYNSYLDRQNLDISNFRKNEERLIPSNFDYKSVCGLSLESVEKFSDRRPASVGEAARIPGITPAAITSLLVALQKNSNA